MISSGGILVFLVLNNAKKPRKNWDGELVFAEKIVARLKEEVWDISCRISLRTALHMVTLLIAAELFFSISLSHLVYEAVF